MGILELLMGGQQSQSLPQIPTMTTGINPDAQVPENVISVVGHPPVPMDEAQAPSYEGNPTRPSINPRYVNVNQDVIPPHEDERGERIERKGMFGVKGTLRDVLGLVGDAFLTQSGNAPVYAPRRREEKIADAMYGYTNGTDAAKGAVERLAMEGFAAESAALNQQVQREAVARENAERQRMAAEALANKRLEDVRNEKVDRIANVAYRLPPDQRSSWILDQLKRHNIDPALAGFSPDDPDSFILGRVSVKDSESFKRKDRSLDQGDQRIGISRQNANTASGRAAEAARANRAREADRDYSNQTSRMREERQNEKDETTQRTLRGSQAYTTRSGRTFTRKD